MQLFSSLSEWTFSRVGMSNGDRCRMWQYIIHFHIFIKYFSYFWLLLDLNLITFDVAKRTSILHFSWLSDSCCRIITNIATTLKSEESLIPFRPPFYSILRKGLKVDRKINLKITRQALTFPGNFREHFLLFRPYNVIESVLRI